MKRKATSPSKSAGLRRQAQSRLRQLQGDPRRIKSDTEVRRLVHELQVHQIELELQNEELKQSAQVARQAVEKFTDLYDFAPIGYFSLDPEGRIMEVNLTGTVMFGVERSGLIQRRFQLFVEEGSRREFNEFLGKAFKLRRKRACEMRLVKANRSHFWADLEAIVTAPGIGGHSWCRVAVVDISARKHAAEVQLRLEVLAASNRRLEKEITQRRRAESALRRSEQKSMRLLEESQRLQEQLRNLAHQILRVQEEERKQISRELHDEISQTLVGINVHLSLLRETSVAIPGALRRQFARTQRLVEKSVDIVHEFARRLRPPQLDDLGLIPALRSFLKEFSERTGIKVELRVFAGIEALGINRRTVLFRVAQEAVINVGKHADATAVSVRITKVPGAVSMEIQDNGKSFVVEEKLNIRKNKRLGLIGMRERVEMIGGRFGINSERAKGTTIEIQIPFRDEGDSRASARNSNDVSGPDEPSKAGGSHVVIEFARKGGVREGS